MSWNERQRRMLAAMGVRLWAPARTTSAVAPAIADAPVAAAVAERPVEAAVARAPASAPVAEVVRAPAPAAARPTTTIAAAAATLQDTLSDPLLAERAATIAALAWGPLHDAVASCTACGLCESRRQTVFGTGHAQADWMIVGEAPGEQEDLAGEPFVGPAGQLLDQMLRAVGQSRRATSGEGQEDDQAGDPSRRVFIANTLKCRPPRNRNPEPDEMARCEPFLKRQVALVKPKLILLMGRFAVKQLLKSDDAIGKLRGRVHHYEGIPVVVTYHPAYLLRNLPEKAKAWEDLCLAKATADAA
jgi:uracil-DNA glycosylase